MAFRSVLSFCRGLVLREINVLHARNLVTGRDILHQWKGHPKCNHQFLQRHFISDCFPKTPVLGRFSSTVLVSHLWPRVSNPHRMHRPQLLSDNINRSSSTHLSSVKAPSSAKTSKASKPARPRTKKPSTLVLKDEGQWLSTAFSTSEEFNLEHFSLDLQTQGNFQVATMPTDAHDVLHMKVITDSQEDEEPSEMFIFRNGCLVFWNVAESTIKQVMKIATKHQSEPYEVALVNWENEQMNYSYGEGKTTFKEDCIVLNGNSSMEVTTLEKFAFSNSMILSVKLAMWEYTLDKFVSSIEHIPEILKASGKLKMSHKSTMKHMGKLYSLRHRINLSSDLLNTPDFYWDRQELEDLFTKMCQFFSISRRTRVMNDKLSHCNDLMDLMRNDVTEQHTLRLEAMITILIGVEILIEIIHYSV